jgi:hypothetical protein
MSRETPSPVKRQLRQEAGFGTIVGEGPLIRVNGEDVFGLNLSDRNLEISLTLYNESDECILEIERNEWVSGDPIPWDIEADWQLLTIRERARKISLDLDARKIPMEMRGELWRSGARVALGPENIVGGRKSGIGNLALVGLKLEVDTRRFQI